MSPLSTAVNLICAIYLSFIGGGVVSLPHPDSAGLNPSWRNALAKVIVEVSMADAPATEGFLQQIDEMKQFALILDQLTPDSGSYLNEVTKKISDKNH